MASKCTAWATGKHRSAQGRANCPACSPATAAAPGLPARPEGVVRNPSWYGFGGDSESDGERNEWQEAARTTSKALLHELAQSGSLSTVLAVLQNSNTSPATLQMVYDAPGGVAYADVLAENIRTPTPVLDSIVGYFVEDRVTGRAIADNPNASPQALTALFGSTHEDTRRSAVRNANMPLSIVKNAMTDSSRRVREGAARNPQLGPEDIEKMARDGRATVRREAAKSHLLSDETLVMLASDESNTVRKNVAMNRSAPLKALAILRKDAESGVRNSADQTLRRHGVKRLGIHPGNDAAIDRILELDDLDDMTQDSAEIVLITAVHRNL